MTTTVFELLFLYSFLFYWIIFHFFCCSLILHIFHFFMFPGPFCNMTPEWYMGDLLTLAHDLADRLILAFDQTNSGLPHPRVHLIDGVPENGRLDTCTAGLIGFLIIL